MKRTNYFSLRIIMLILLALIGAGGCGKSKDKGGSNDEEQQAEDTTLREVKGVVTVGSEDLPAENYTIVAYNHTSGAAQTRLVNASGAFTFPLESFESGSTYSFHVVDDAFKYVS